ncbi:hypothetical protein SERLA73DRAFT_135503, partial [Serpula lacrymans var. lacrymans S7.3]
MAYQADPSLLENPIRVCHVRALLGHLLPFPRDAVANAPSCRFKVALPRDKPCCCRRFMRISWQWLKAEISIHLCSGILWVHFVFSKEREFL